MATVEQQPAGARTRLARLAATVERVHDALNTLAWSDRKAWAAAENLEDLCALTVGWLTGELKSQPGYHGPADVDAVPDLLDALVSLNQAGFLTRGSQMGHDGVAALGWHWTQIAAVEGFAKPTTVARLRATLAGTPYEVHAAARPRWPRRASSVVVTLTDGREYTDFGGFGRERAIWGQFEGAGSEAVAEAVDALQVVIYDPEPGRNTLWSDLRAVL